MNKRKSPDPRALEIVRDLEKPEHVTRLRRRLQDQVTLKIARDLEKRGFHIDVKSVEPMAAKLVAALYDSIALRDRTDEALEKKLEKKFEALKQAALAQLIPPAAQRKQQAAVIMRELEARVDELRRRGVRNPITRARDELAVRHGRANGAALNKWLRRNRVRGTKMSG